MKAKRLFLGKDNNMQKEQGYSGRYPCL